MKSILTSGQLSKKKAACVLRANYSDISNSLDALIERKFIKFSERQMNLGHNPEKFYKLTERGLMALLEIKINQDEFWRAIILLCNVSKERIDDEKFEYYFRKYESNSLGHFNSHGYFFLIPLFDNILERWQQVNDNNLDSISIPQKVIECLAFHGPINMHKLAKKTGVSEKDIVKVLNFYSVQSNSLQQKLASNYTDADCKSDINIEKVNSDYILHLLIVAKKKPSGLVYELSLFGLMLMIAIIAYHFVGSQISDHRQYDMGNSTYYQSRKLFYNRIDLKQYFDILAANYKDKIPLIFGKWGFLRSQLGLILYDSFDFLLYKANRSHTIEETIWFSGTKEYYDEIKTLTHNAIKLLYPIHIFGTTNISKFEKCQPWIANSPMMEPVYRKLREIGEILKYNEIITTVEELKDKGHSRKLLRSRLLYTTNYEDIKNIEDIFKEELTFLFFLTLRTSVLSKSYRYSSRPSRSKTGTIIIPHETKEVFELGGPEERLMAIFNKDKDIRNWFSTWIEGVIEYRRQTSEKMLEFYGLITNSKGHKKEIRLQSNANRKAVAVYEEYDFKKICIDDFDTTYDYSTM